MNAPAKIDDATREAYRINERAKAAALPISERIELHRQRERKVFADIARIAATVNESTGLIGMERAKLALAYCLEALEMNSADNLEYLETECGIQSEFAHTYEDKRDRFQREWRI